MRQSLSLPSDISHEAGKSAHVLLCTVRLRWLLHQTRSKAAGGAEFRRENGRYSNELPRVPLSHGGKYDTTKNSDGLHNTVAP